MTDIFHCDIVPVALYEKVTHVDNYTNVQVNKDIDITFSYYLYFFYEE